jgi:hypothetical protein
MQWAQAHAEQTPFLPLTQEQIRRIMNRGRELHRWYSTHHRTHCLINAAVLSFLLLSDYFVLLELPGVWLAPETRNPVGSVILAAVIVGAIRCWLMYSLGVFSIHEGAAHKAIFPPIGPVSRIGHFLASNLSRVVGSDPIYYAGGHMRHHSKFGTKDDEEFLNFVSPRRYWPTFLPFAMAINYSDFVAHRTLRPNLSSLVTTVVALAYQGTYGYLMYRRWGLLFVLVATFFFTNVGFYIDRVRQFTEHNLMPLDNLNGARSFGLGFWGMLIGGGPWGSPCHWEHHLVASIPWYQQLILHRYVVKMLTPEQRKQFLIEPVVGYPKLWWRLIRETNSFMRSSAARQT